jgi:hypothetical protein
VEDAVCCCWAASGIEIDTPGGDGIEPVLCRDAGGSEKLAGAGIALVLFGRKRDDVL